MKIIISILYIIFVEINKKYLIINFKMKINYYIKKRIYYIKTFLIKFHKIIKIDQKVIIFHYYF